MGREGGGTQGTQGPPSYRVWGEGEALATVLVLHTLEMHVDLSFSYLRFAEAASFDKKSYAGAVQRGSKHFLVVFYY